MQSQTLHSEWTPGPDAPPRRWPLRRVVFVVVVVLLAATQCSTLLAA